MVLLLLSSSFKKAHRYYFSFSEIKLNQAKKTVEFSFKLFTDDVEDALFKLNHNKVNLAVSENSKGVQKQVSDYLHERFKIVINGLPANLELIGFETENDICWFYLESKAGIEKAGQAKIKITNTLLYDFLPEQTNIMHLIWNEQERTEKLTNPAREVEVTF